MAIESVAEFDPYLQWLGIRDPQRPPNHYRLLGLELFESNETVIANAADRQMAHVRTFQAGSHGELSQKVLNELAAARVCLLKTDKKAAYDQQLRARAAAARPAPAIPKANAAQAAAPRPVATATAAASRPAAARSGQPNVASPFDEIATAAASTHSRANSRRKRKQQKSLAPYALAAVLLLAVAVVGLNAMRAKPNPKVASNPPTTNGALEHDEKRPAPPTDKPDGVADEPPINPKDEPDKNPATNPDDNSKPPLPNPVTEDVKPPGDQVASNDTGTAELPTELPDGESGTDNSDEMTETGSKPEEQQPETPVTSKEEALPYIGPRLLDDKLLAIPSDEDRKAALDRIRDIFGTDIDQARTAEAKQKLANQLLEQANSTKSDDTAQFVLLNLVKDMAIAAEDIELAQQAIDLQSERYAVEPMAAKYDALIEINRHARNAKSRAALVPIANQLVDAAVERADFALAIKLNKFVQLAATKSRDREAMKSTLARDKAIKELLRQQETAIAALAKIKADPNVSQANFELGAYLCFIKQDWDQGLLRLSKSSHPLLQDAALKELAKPTEAAKQKQLADLWLKCAEDKALAEWSDGMKSRAREHYQQSVERLTGLDKAEVEKTLKGWAEARTETLVGKELELKLSGNVAIKFRKISPGRFVMGSSADEPGRESDELQHMVTLTKPFYLGITEVTQAQWQTVMGSNPSTQQGETFPVQNVNWDGAVRFCDALNNSPLGTKYLFRLPTEAEWEFACRAGTQSAFFFGSDPRLMPEFAWSQESASDKMMPVAKLRPNPWGLFDMAGNVCEWTSDWRGPYPNSPVTDPNGTNSGTVRAHRGCSNWHTFKYLRSAQRGGNPPGEVRVYIGLRIACESR